MMTDDFERRGETPAGGHRGIEAALRASRADGFAPGFAWRVMRRLREAEANPADALARALQRYLARLAPVAAVLAALLAIHNLRAADARQPTLDAALGLPAVTIDAAYSLDAVAAPAGGGEGRG
jgi:hypothetical protein